MLPSLLLRVIAPSAVVGLVCAAINIGALGPIGRDARDFQVATATAHFLVDLPGPTLVNRSSPPADVRALIRRGELLGGVMASPQVVEFIGRRARLPAGQIGAGTRTTASVPLVLSEPGSERRASDIADSTRPYRLEIHARQTTPVIDVYSQAPTTAEALRLATASAGGLLDYLASEAAREGIAGDLPIRLKPLGRARGDLISGGSRPSVAFLTFLVAFGLSCAALGFVRQRRSQHATAGTGVMAHGRSASAALPEQPERSSLADDDPLARRTDDWPRTPRLLPWTLALFMAVLWLVPFNSIELNATLPIDLKFDRLVLPIVIGAWLLALVAGGRMAPRVRITRTHVALGAFIASAFLSVVLSAKYLNQIGELDLSIKKLPLLLSYVSLFVIIASGVRRSEVRAFLTYTLILAVICGLGLMWENRFKTNPFFDMSSAILPGGLFSIGEANAEAIDAIGRPVVRGPAEVGLEAVTMLSLALAIALVRFLDSEHLRQRAIYGVALCIVLAATVATFRKSALVAPVSVVLTLAYFRRQQLLKLAPIGLVLAVVMQALSPGALRGVTAQFFRQDRLDVPTVSDRTSDYDAIRPDLWTHFAFGRGFGSYNHDTYRILDSEILQRLIETGVLGLACFLLIPIVVIANARRTINYGDRSLGPIALIGASAGTCFLTVATLYDVLSFPHATYIFLYVAGLVAVGTGAPSVGSEARPPERSRVRSPTATARTAGRPLQDPPIPQRSCPSSP